jgi:microcystin-dependent protein
MSEPFIGEVRIFPYGWAPKGWALCDGSLVAIRSNTALFSVIGTSFGGDGVTNFALPNYTQSVVVGAGTGPGLSPYTLGEVGGVPNVTLTVQQMPPHAHTVNTMSDPGTINVPANNTVLARANASNVYASTISTAVPMDSSVLSPFGSAAVQPHDNHMPSLSVNFCIAVAGVFPPRP